MKSAVTSSQPTRKKGIALITVISVIAILTVLVVAMISMADQERSSATIQSDAEKARQLSDSAVNMMIGQVWAGTSQTATTPSGRSIWASQPGAIRRYGLNGQFQSGYRLYTSSQMVVTGTESQMLADAPPATWNNETARFADLNEPVIRPDANGDGLPEVYFPIVDPRAYVNNAGSGVDPSIEGFSIGKDAHGTAPAINGMVVATSPTDTNARLPMPVEWLYVLKDGSVGSISPTATANGYQYVPADGGTVPTEGNPIVGRIAAWTDDESCRVNINTAGEAAYWTTPNVPHMRDYYYAFSPPTSFEYQRYPGHPASVSLSTILFPNEPMDLYGLTRGSNDYDEIWRRKERIYEIMPKINSGGSKSGTVPYWWIDDPASGYTNTNYSVNVTQSLRERLYASVDELYFSEQVNQTKRASNDYMQGTQLFTDPSQLERIRFFLSAHSRAPELTMYGTPRISIWPVADESLPHANNSGYRTGFDAMIAYCSSLIRNQSNTVDKSFYFRRKDSRSSTVDINIARNQDLLKYLYRMLQQPMPGGSSYVQKYGEQNVKSLLMQIFDYVRITNLYDGYLAPPRTTLAAASGDYNFSGKSNKDIYTRRDSYMATQGRVKTFTPDRGTSSTSSNVNDRVTDQSFPGHGAVVPSEWDFSSPNYTPPASGAGDPYKGHGRFITLSELGLHFICTADGDKDKGSYAIRTKVGPAWRKSTADADISGGRTAVKIGHEKAGRGGYALTSKYTDKWLGIQNDFWYSNFPPRPAPGRYGTSTTVTGTEDPRSPDVHPGYKPENWNITLDDNKPLEVGERRVQACLAMELFCSALGYTEFHPDATIVVEGLQNLKVTDSANNVQPLFTGNAPMVWKTSSNIYRAYHARPLGGNVDHSNMAMGRRSRPVNRTGVNNVINDFGYDTASGIHDRLSNYDFVSDFVTVKAPKMTFTGGTITVKIYAGHDWANSSPLIQTINVEIPSSSDVPAPDLVIMSTDYDEYIDSRGNKTTRKALDAPHWWAFNYSGAIGRYAGTRLAPTLVSKPWANTAGRLWNGDTNTANIAIPVDSGGNAVNFGGDAAASSGGAPLYNSIIYGYDSSTGDFNSGLLRLDSARSRDNSNDIHSDTQLSDPNTDGNPGRRGHDVVITMVPRHGDLRVLALKKNVPATDWVQHPVWDMNDPSVQRANKLGISSTVMFAHNLSRGFSTSDPGADKSDSLRRLVPTAPYSSSKIPDLAGRMEAIMAASRFGDYDAGLAFLRDGPFINKPDEGSTTARNRGFSNTTRRSPTAYFLEEWVNEEAGEGFMTPNRMVSSAVQFGSLLPMAKNSIPSVSGVAAGPEPWATLLFRPYSRPMTLSGTSSSPGGLNRHPGSPGWWMPGQGGNGVDPADHYLLDLFWMPVVEPYAISEPLSTAGKVNMNYQIVPFAHFRRATGMHAILKGQQMHAIPTAAANIYRERPAGATFEMQELMGDANYWHYSPWTDSNASKERYSDLYPGANNSSQSHAKKFWHRYVEIEKAVGAQIGGTLRQFEDRFKFVNGLTTPPASQGLFRTTSQICEIFLVPRKVQTESSGDGGDSQTGTPYNPNLATNNGLMQFWADRAMTADNLRERPYSEILPKLTTQSNVFRVHYRTQVIKKARSGSPAFFNPAGDSVTAEYRGYSIIERKADLGKIASNVVNDPADGNSLTPLDGYYFMRLIENKRFAP